MVHYEELTRFSIFQSCYETFANAAKVGDLSLCQGINDDGLKIGQYWLLTTIRPDEVRPCEFRLYHWHEYGKVLEFLTDTYCNAHCTFLLKLAFTQRFNEQG